MSRRIAIIPARGGSQRIPRKNIREFCGRPIIEYSIRAAYESELFEDVVVTTDDDEIERVAKNVCATVVRRPTDDGSRGTQDVAREVLLQMPEVDMACVIYPTSPLLLPIDLITSGALLYFPPRQFVMSVGDSPLRDAGCFYWGWASAFHDRVPLIAPQTAMYALPAERVCDINTNADWTTATYLYQALRRAQR